MQQLEEPIEVAPLSGKVGGESIAEPVEADAVLHLIVGKHVVVEAVRIELLERHVVQIEVVEQASKAPCGMTLADVVDARIEVEVLARKRIGVAAELFARLQHQHRSFCSCASEGSHEAADARADDDDVVVFAHDRFPWLVTEVPDRQC